MAFVVGQYVAFVVGQYSDVAFVVGQYFSMVFVMSSGQGRCMNRAGSSVDFVPAPDNKCI